MDLSWCIMCDCQSNEDNLYCSESCRIQDVNHKHATIKPTSTPVLDPFYSSFQHERRRTSVTISKSIRSVDLYLSSPTSSLRSQS
ncbi:uncharacterized protein EV154DRAFT_565147 [Mucor mucedo]|uniref:uncharacterized protein n=1 Tax=Mucor mucedo TaxID=29922 RepID=UPI00221EF42A|nr:uncharacterized protein EV154DRAFT_565147 [Mucor mucedo]KAI7889706.1 hypothetical protein EV154DRAFT_565147 [Mucor mucedo]